MTLWAVFASIYACALLLTLWGGLSARAFLSRYPTIPDRLAMDAFKRLARLNMYLALVQIGVLGSGFVVGIVVILRHGTVRGLGAVLVANGIVVGLGKLIRALEIRARSLPCATPELSAEHARVAESWVRKPLPDF